MDIVDKVRQRLYGDTQVILQELPLFAPTQIIEPTKPRLPQLEVDPRDFQQPVEAEETQAETANETLSQLFVDDSPSPAPDSPPVLESTNESAPQSSARNPLKELLDNFDSDEEPAATSPPTLPKVNSDVDILEVIKPRKANPIDEYAQKLKRELANDEMSLSDDDVPKLSKVQTLLVKLRLAKVEKVVVKANLYSELKRENMRQLRKVKEADPDANNEEEIEREEEEMGNILEREIERARRIRKQEKMAEKGTDEDVPESDGYESEKPEDPEEDEPVGVRVQSQSEPAPSIQFSPRAEKERELFQNLATQNRSADTSFGEDVVAVAPSFQDISQTTATQVDGTLADAESDDEPELLNPEEPTEEEKAENLRRLEVYEAKIRRKELLARKRRLRLEKLAAKNILEGEAEESDDEWHGVGGADEEVSDEADSDDERMIDNDFGLDLNDEAVRKKFMEEHKIRDRRELEKLLADVQNHKLSRRARHGLDVELSDEEDELLLAYRRQKLQEQRARGVRVTDDKTRAFFEHEEAAVVLSDSDDKVEASFVQQQLSFLSRTLEHEYARIQDDDDLDGFALLKRSLSIRMEEVPTDRDEPSDDERVFKRPSVVQLFRAQHREAQVAGHFLGVTVHKQYKVASGAKAAITYMGRKKTAAVKSSRTLALEQSVSEMRDRGGLFRSLHADKRT